MRTTDEAAVDHVTLRIPKYALVITLLVAVAAAVGGVGFALGRDSAPGAHASSTEAAGAERAAYRDGVAAGRKAAQPRRTYAEGRAEGRRRGSNEGADAALGGERFSLRGGAYYIVRFAPGERGVKLRLDRVVELAADRAYQLCGDYQLCYR